KNLIILGSDTDSIILDSFAGSGTTGHAVLHLNKETCGNRKFILIECEDYANRTTAERIRRVIKGIPESKEKSFRDGLNGSFSYFELGEPIEIENILEGKNLPSYNDLARYVFYTATGEEFVPENIDESRSFIGESKDYAVYLFYKPDLEYLKSTALTLEMATSLPNHGNKKKLVFAPTKYLDLNDSELVTKHGLKNIEYCQLPYEIYRLKD
ncbi:MAG: site-specific DNA-methyltransferase, partial [Fibrobacter sp.]|nr:site-specific DNA-methyltransferase [Fibrobacter sp.]